MEESKLIDRKKIKQEVKDMIIMDESSLLDVENRQKQAREDSQVIGFAEEYGMEEDSVGENCGE